MKVTVSFIDATSIPQPNLLSDGHMVDVEVKEIVGARRVWDWIHDSVYVQVDFCETAQIALDTRALPILVISAGDNR